MLPKIDILATEKASSNLFESTNMAAFPPSYTAQPQPTIVNVMVFDRYPMSLNCPHCKQNIVTTLSYRGGILTWLCVGGLFITWWVIFIDITKKSEIPKAWIIINSKIQVWSSLEILTNYYDLIRFCLNFSFHDKVHLFKKFMPQITTIFSCLNLIFSG